MAFDAALSFSITWVSSYAFKNWLEKGDCG
jgi:hypothetical protein